jgi:hypothetical protein
MLPLPDLKHNTVIVQQFRSSIVRCNINHIPEMVECILTSRAWEERLEAGHVYKHDNLLSFITAPPLSGCGWEPKTVEALLKQAKSDQDLLRRWREAVTRPKHVHGDGNDVPIRPHRGNSRAYTLTRLAGHHPALYRRVLAGELSANAAALAAGFRKTPTAFERILKLLPSLTPDERAELIARLTEP